MKRTIITVVLVACAAMLMTQCKKTDVQKPATDETIDVTLVVDNDAKTVIDGANGNITWEVGDKIHVVGETTGYLGYLTAQSSGNPVTFSGAINYSSVKQVFHYYYVGSNNFTLDSDGCYTFSIATGQDGTLATIANKFQLMYGNSGYALPAGISDLGSTVMRTKTAIANFKFSRDDGAPFVNTVHVTGAYTSMKFNAKTADFEGAVKNTDMLTINCTENSKCYMTLIPGTQTLNFSQYVVFANLPEKTIEENSLYGEKTVEMHVSSDVPAGALPGKFKISANEYVYFSKGNLYYNTSLTPNWGFEANQWDYQSYPSGWASVNGTFGDNTSSGWGLFGYSSTKTGNNYGVSYSTTDSDYEGDFRDWGGLFGELPGSRTWYSMNSTQINYFRDNAIRTNANASFKLITSKGTITIYGFLFLPCTTPSSEVASIKTAIQNDISKLESYGAVFFPQTSRRNGKDREENGHGYLRHKDDYQLWGYGETFTTGSFWGHASIGGCVRLVCDANNSNIE